MSNNDRFKEAALSNVLEHITSTVPQEFLPALPYLWKDFTNEQDFTGHLQSEITKAFGLYVAGVLTCMKEDSHFIKYLNSL